MPSLSVRPGHGRRKARRRLRLQRRLARRAWSRGGACRERRRRSRSKPSPSHRQCLAELGYYKGTVDGKRGKETWTAYWHFKHDHGLKGYSDLLAEPVQQKLAPLCKQKAEETAAAAARADPLYEPEGEVGAPPEGALAEADARRCRGGDVALAAPEEEESACLRPDGPPRYRLPLRRPLAVLRRAHGRPQREALRQRAACRRRGVWPRAQLDEMQAKNAVVWCRACVPIDGNLALDDVRRIERAGNARALRHPAAAVVTLRRRRQRRP